MPASELAHRSNPEMSDLVLIKKKSIVLFTSVIIINSDSYLMQLVGHSLVLLHAQANDKIGFA